MSKNPRNWKNAAFTQAKRFRPMVESLESRLNLAGNVFVSFSGGNLFLTGDNLSNALRIEGNGPGVFEVAGVNTSLGGVANGVRNFAGVRNIFINMNGGDDVATFVTADLAGILSFSGGNGNDRLLFGEGNNEDQFFGSLSALMGAGNDEVAIVGEGFLGDAENNFTILGNVLINGGEGNNDVDFDSVVSLTLGNVLITNGFGNDFVDIGDVLVNTRSIVVNNGGGDNNLFLDGDFTINGNLIVTGGNGDDEVNPGDTGFDFFTVTGAVSLNLGNGDNLVSFEQLDTFVQFGTAIVTGGGDDFIEFLGETTNLGAVAISTGAGNDGIDFISTVSTTIRGPVVIDTGFDDDTVTLFAADVQSVATLNTGEGNDEVFIDNSLFRQVVALYTLGGLDRVAIEAGGNNDGVGTVFQNAVYVFLGAGDDDLEVGFDANDFVTTLGLVYIEGGLGNDFIVDSGTNFFLQNPTLVSIA